MRLNVTDLPAEGILLEDNLDPLRLRDLAALEETQACTFTDRLWVSLQVTPGAGLFHVEGRIQGKTEMACSRGLKSLEHILVSDFTLTFARTVPGSESGGAPDNRELKAAEMGLVPFEGEEIDFRDAVQEQVIMAIPMQPLCRADCRGLCPGCGADLNVGTCHCRQNDVDPRLAILKKLKLDS